MKSLALSILFILSIHFFSCDYGVEADKHYPIYSETGTFIYWGVIECFPHDLYLFYSQQPNSQIDTSIHRYSRIDFTFEVHHKSKTNSNDMRYTGKLLTMKKHND